ncbi:hypothetical protein CerSpe_057670 [Prunus speciosa]
MEKRGGAGLRDFGCSGAAMGRRRPRKLSNVVANPYAKSAIRLTYGGYLYILPISHTLLLKVKEMEGMKASSSSTSSNTGMMSRMKKDCLFFYVSLQEGFRNLKALFVGQAKKLTARNEQEATEAELRTSKMQVEAADAAEETKKKLSNSKSA